MDILTDDREALRKVYGTSLGIAYHYYCTLSRVYRGVCGIAEFYPYTVGGASLGRKRLNQGAGRQPDSHRR